MHSIMPLVDSNEQMSHDPLPVRKATPEELARGLSLISGLAAPRLFARRKDVPSREVLLEEADGLIRDAGYWAVRHKDAAERERQATLKAHASRVRALLDAWVTPSVDIPLEIREAARAYLTAMGCAMPAEGWDQFDEPWRDQEPAPLDPSHLPSERSAALALEHGRARREGSRLMRYLALPMVVARTGKMPSRATMLKVLDAFILAMEHDASVYSQPGSSVGERVRAQRAHACALRELVSAWIPSVDVPTPLRAEARACLDVEGEEPGEGWDAYDGPWSSAFPDEPSEGSPA